MPLQHTILERLGPLYAAADGELAPVKPAPERLEPPWVEAFPHESLDDFEGRVVREERATKGGPGPTKATIPNQKKNLQAESYKTTLASAPASLRPTPLFSGGRP